MNRFIIATAAVATLVAGPAFASDPAKKPAMPSMTQKVCAVRPAITGTMFSSKVCKTRAEWIAQNGVDPSKK